MTQEVINRQLLARAKRGGRVFVITAIYSGLMDKVEIHRSKRIAEKRLDEVLAEYGLVRGEDQGACPHSVELREEWVMA